MKTLASHINEALKIGKNLSKFSTYSCQPKTKDELKFIIKSRITEEGPNCDLNNIDVSLIDDMSYLFVDSKFNGNISKWDVSRVKTMYGMFYNSSFNGNINDWDVSNVLDMTSMFVLSKFNQDASNWKINERCVMYDTFFRCPIKEEFKPKSLQS